MRVLHLNNLLSITMQGGVECNDYHCIMLNSSSAIQGLERTVTWKSHRVVIHYCSLVSVVNWTRQWISSVAWAVEPFVNQLQYLCESTSHML